MVLNSVLGPDPDNFENCQWSDFCKVKKHLERNYGILGGMKLGWDGYIEAWWHAGSDAPLIDIERMQQQLPPVLTRDSGLVSGGCQ